ncbi:CRISPR-associated endonuclease Cas2 [Leptotrichia alba]|uniref:CRISPR-associated endoribonuclease Cas2 n=1 Tax=Leptotrichia alba TaxID=3239304 RepID=A0AB39V157_9FUSO
MMTWFIYDITDDRNRSRLIKIAQKHGLYRVQKSVFLGNIEKDEIDQIIKESKKVINLREDSVYIFPVCETDYKKATLLGLSFEEDIVKDEKPVLFF